MPCEINSSTSQVPHTPGNDGGLLASHYAMRLRCINLFHQSQRSVSPMSFWDSHSTDNFNCSVSPSLGGFMG